MSPTGSARSSPATTSPSGGQKSRYRLSVVRSPVVTSPIQNADGSSHRVKIFADGKSPADVAFAQINGAFAFSADVWKWYVEGSDSARGPTARLTKLNDRRSPSPIVFAGSPLSLNVANASGRLSVASLDDASVVRRLGNLLGDVLSEDESVLMDTLRVPPRVADVDDAISDSECQSPHFVKPHPFGAGKENGAVQWSIAGSGGVGTLGTAFRRPLATEGRPPSSTAISNAQPAPAPAQQTLPSPLPSPQKAPQKPQPQLPALQLDPANPAVKSSRPSVLVQLPPSSGIQRPLAVTPPGPFVQSPSALTSASPVFPAAPAAPTQRLGANARPFLPTPPPGGPAAAPPSAPPPAGAPGYPAGISPTTLYAQQQQQQYQQQIQQQLQQRQMEYHNERAGMDHHFSHQKKMMLERFQQDEATLQQSFQALDSQYANFMHHFQGRWHGIEQHFRQRSQPAGQKPPLLPLPQQQHGHSQQHFVQHLQSLHNLSVRDATDMANALGPLQREREACEAAMNGQRSNLISTRQQMLKQQQEQLAELNAFHMNQAGVLEQHHMQAIAQLQQGLNSQGMPGGFVASEPSPSAFGGTGAFGPALGPSYPGGYPPGVYNSVSPTEDGLGGYGAPPYNGSGRGSRPSSDDSDQSVALTKPGDARARDHALSPATKTKFKDFFMKPFRQREKDSYESARKFALNCIKQLPEKLHWRVYLGLADLAKRENMLKVARKYYGLVNKLQPRAPQGWLDYAKMEEECGEMLRCQRILALGLAFCPYNEALMVKGIRHEERMDNLPAARALLGRLKNVNVEKVWKTLVEGGLLEVRAGNMPVARKVFSYLMKKVPWYGPIYFEAFKAEEKCENLERAISIIEKGLREVPRYGPLWFSALHLAERISQDAVDASLVRQCIEQARRNITKELVWKVHFEAAQIEERLTDDERCREEYALAVRHCPANLKWKVWLGGARTELNSNNVEGARQLLQQALACVPKKMKAIVLLECARLEECVGELDKARAILKKARSEIKHEWKLFLESVLLEVRAHDIPRAIERAESALKVHSGTGRLWAILIQLRQYDGVDAQLAVFRKALLEVPKSGEVWCEGARIYMSPLSRLFNLEAARRALDFAVQFTPQYGDSFIEYLRLELLDKGPDASTAEITQACINADPNYGSVWFHCKLSPLDSTQQVLRVAWQILQKELREHHAIYQAAILRSQSATEPADAVLDAAEKAGGYCPADFSTGIISLNRMYRNIASLSDAERRKLFFGADTPVV